MIWWIPLGLYNKRSQWGAGGQTAPQTPKMGTRKTKNRNEKEEEKGEEKGKGEKKEGKRREKREGMEKKKRGKGEEQKKGKEERSKRQGKEGLGRWMGNKMHRPRLNINFTSISNGKLTVVFNP